MNDQEFNKIKNASYRMILWIEFTIITFLLFLTKIKQPAQMSIIPVTACLSVSIPTVKKILLISGCAVIVVYEPITYITYGAVFGPHSSWFYIYVKTVYLFRSNMNY